MNTKRLLLFCLFLIGLKAFANQAATSLNTALAEEYRKHGLKNIEKLLDLQLTKPDFWNHILKKHDTTYGFFDQRTDLLWCNKSTKELALYSVNGKLTLKEKTPIILGRAPGDKWEEGDGKTPLGIYRIIEKKTKLDEKYGPLAFVTNYPNRFDRIWGKNGHGIWLHGTPPNCDKNATQGCVALNNQSLLELDAKLDPKHALLVINDGNLHKLDKQSLPQLLAFIFSWRYAWKYNDFDAYLRKYSPNLVFKEHHDFHYFRNYKKRVFQKYEGRKKHLHFTDILLVPYPNSFGKKLWYLTFKEEFIAPGYRYIGPKSILIEEKPPQHFQIVVE